MPRIGDGLALTFDLKWALTIGAALVSLGGILYQNNELAKDVARLEAKQTQMNDAVVSVVQTLRNNGTIR